MSKKSRVVIVSNWIRCIKPKNFPLDIFDVILLFSGMNVELIFFFFIAIDIDRTRQMRCDERLDFSVCFLHVN